MVEVVDLVVTAYNKIPYETSLNVIAPGPGAGARRCATASDALTETDAGGARVVVADVERRADVARTDGTASLARAVVAAKVSPAFASFTDDSL